jgi:hypothetical protein
MTARAAGCLARGLAVLDDRNREVEAAKARERAARRRAA